MKQISKNKEVPRGISLEVTNENNSNNNYNKILVKCNLY